ncbi:MAG: adenylate/guanylate cyclase domain-containing protein [Actinomycetota bacterium]
MTCSVCGEPLPDDARFCPNCGTVVGSSLGTEERKLVTVLFADLVESTALAQRLDPERAREVLGRFYDAVTEELRALRGQPEKFIGDAVMAVFGLPHVHEDDAARAVRAGLAIRGHTRRLAAELGLDHPLDVRVGVETGEAATGVGPSGQLLVTGPVVNAAARLQTAAQPGEVLAGATTFALTEHAVSFGDRRDVEAKGFAEPLVAYPVDGLTPRTARRTIPFVGRANELTLLRDAHARVEATSRPLLVTLIGEPGIGKSRLADEFLAGIEHPGNVLVGRGQLASGSATFAPAATIVREAAGIEHGEPGEKSLRRLRELVERWSDGDEADRTAERLALALGLAAKRREESAFIQEVQSGVLSMVTGLATEAPVTLLFEDVHTMRAPMMDLVERLAGRASQSPGRATVLAAARPELLDARPGWGSRAANHVLLHLEPLGDDDAVALARQAGGPRIPETEARTIAARAGGNPFFIVETTGMLLGRGEATTAGSEGTLPPTVQAVIAARLDSLPSDQRELARRLSVYLYSFDAEEAALVADCSADAMDQLVDAELVVPDLGGGPPRWRFRHETLRDVAYASLPKRLRLQLHLTIADTLQDLEPTYTAAHLERAAFASVDLDPSDRTVPDRAVAALAEAGDRQRRRMENRGAVDYYGRALALAGDDERFGVREARVLAGLGEARYWLGEYPGAVEVLDRAVDLGTTLHDHWTLTHALRFLGDIANNVDGDLERAETLLARSLAAAEALEDPWAIVRTLLFTGWIPWTRRRYEEAEPIWRRALEIAREHGDRWAEVRALTALSINAENMDAYDEAKALIDEAGRLAEEMDDLFSVAVARVQHARLHEDEEEYEDALPDFEHAIVVFSDLGARWELGDALAERGIVLRELGRLDEAEDDLRQAIRISEELGERQLASWTWRARARVAEKRGDRAAADERFRRAAQAEAERLR